MVTHQNAASEPVPCPLSAFELTNLALAADGLSNKDIAEQRHVTVNTVKTQLANTDRTLAVRDRAHAVATALRNRWIP